MEVRSTLRTSTGACANTLSIGLAIVRSEEREAKKDAMLAEINGPANSQVGLVASIVGAAHGGVKEERDSDSGASFHMTYTQAVMTADKKAPAGTTVEAADGTILPGDGFGIVEGDLDQPGTTTKPVTMVAVAYGPGLSRNLLSTRKAVEHGVNRSSSTKRRLFWGFRGRSCSFSTSVPARDCFP